MPMTPGRRARTLASAGIAAALALAGGCAGGHSPRATAPAIHWHQCARSSQSFMECATLRVPVDYQHPGGRKLTLALDMVPATAPGAHRQGDLLVNPGGPGGSGLSLAAQVAGGLRPDVAAAYNIIGFDPRGVGASVPAIRCEPGFFSGVGADFIPASRAAEQALVARARAYAASCGHQWGWLLPFMTTANVARDMDAIRAALHQRTISFYGYSYGTYLGQVYATMFGRHLRRMVLDSIVDPAGAWYADNIAQDYAFQGRMDAFFAWAASHHSTYHLGATPAAVRRQWYAARAALAAHPIRPPGIGADEFDNTFLLGGYVDFVWPELASGLSDYLRRHSTRVMTFDFKNLGVQNPNEFAVYTAVECADVAWPRDWAKWDADTRRVYRTAPFLAWDNTWFNAACAFWPVHGPASPPRVGATGLPGILMVQGTLDPATPYQGAQVAHRDFPTARMVVIEGGGNHGQSLQQVPNPCVDGYVNRYLATGALPARPGAVSATCAPTPPPSPGA